ncbi:MAG TPA: DUF2804 family protein [Solirubrobacteraceae bacterium]|jgi:hypothetical protein
MSTPLPYRGVFGEPRPAALASLALPPAPMPARQGLQVLKAWRYVGVFGPEVMLCLASIRIGSARQSFWAVWDRAGQRLHERTRMGPSAVSLSPGRAAIRDHSVELELRLDEGPGIETVCPSGRSYAWTRKQGGIRAHGWIAIDGRRRQVDARAVIDDTAAYYQRHTSWHWSAGVGHAVDGRELAWNLVSGVNDPPRNSERTAWIGGEPSETGPVGFDPPLTRVGGLRFSAERTRRHNQNLLLVRSSYRQPFGTFSGELAGVELAAGYGVMEEHDVFW